MALGALFCMEHDVTATPQTAEKGLLLFCVASMMLMWPFTIECLYMNGSIVRPAYLGRIHVAQSGQLFASPGVHCTAAPNTVLCLYVQCSETFPDQVRTGEGFTGLP
jgi:hypothetical protein